MRCKIFYYEVPVIGNFKNEMIEFDINSWLDEINDDLNFNIVIDKVCQTENNNNFIITIFYHQEQV